MALPPTIVQEHILQYERQIAEINTVLAHEHGFEAAYQQYLYIYENTGNRYFLNTNGWAGLFAAQTLDFPLFLAVLILATTVFCSEYNCQMDALLRTAPQSRKSAGCKVVMTLCAVFALCGGLALIRFAFFGIKYGLALLGLSAVCCSLMVWWVLRQNTNFYSLLLHALK